MSATPPKREQAISQYGKVLDDCKATTPPNARTAKELREAEYQACVALAGATKELGPKTPRTMRCRRWALRRSGRRRSSLPTTCARRPALRRRRSKNLALIHARAMARDPAQRKAADEFLQKE